VADTLVIDMHMRGGSLILVTRPGIAVDAGALAGRYTDIELGPEAEPGARVILRVQVTGRMRYGYVGTR
jgi:hypothetical protein